MPIEDVESLYLYGEVDLNTKAAELPLAEESASARLQLLRLLCRLSTTPREYLHSGYLLVHQVSHYAGP